MSTHAECGGRLCGDCYDDGWDAQQKDVEDLKQQLSSLKMEVEAIVKGRVDQHLPLEAEKLIDAVKRSRQ